MSEPFVIEQKQADGSYQQLIPLGYINENKLINSNFTNPVNQRGQSRYSFNEGYTIDRWKLRFSGDGALTVGNGYISLYRPTYQAYLHQIFEHPENYANKTWTLSALVRGSGNLAFFNSGARLAEQSFAYSDWTVVSLTYTFGTLEPSNTVSAEISSQANYEAFFKWVKLEDGAIATPYVPKGYGAELAECLRYYETNTSVGTTNGLYTANTYTQMAKLYPKRIIPTINILSQTSQIAITYVGKSSFRYSCSLGVADFVWEATADL